MNSIMNIFKPDCASQRMRILEMEARMERMQNLIDLYREAAEIRNEVIELQKRLIAINELEIESLKRDKTYTHEKRNETNTTGGPSGSGHDRHTGASVRTGNVTKKRKP